MNLKQGNEKGETYASKFKKLANRVNAGGIPDAFKGRMVLSGLNKELVTLVAIQNPVDLDTAITQAKTVEAGRYYATKHDFSKPKVEDDIEKLSKQFEKMALNQVNIMAALTNNLTERKTYNPEGRPRKELICFRCGEKGHIARRCLSEKVLPQESWRTRNDDQNRKEVNM